jgi:hypothetical protein
MFASTNDKRWQYMHVEAEHCPMTIRLSHVLFHLTAACCSLKRPVLDEQAQLNDGSTIS